MTADQWALWGCGIYFLTGLLTGVWKYWQVATSEKGVPITTWMWRTGPA